MTSIAYKNAYDHWLKMQEELCLQSYGMSYDEWLDSKARDELGKMSQEERE